MDAVSINGLICHFENGLVLAFSMFSFIRYLPNSWNFLWDITCDMECV